MKAKRPHVIAIAGGKGGVGKSLVANYLTQYLCLVLKKHALVVDYDLEGPNLHTILGQHTPPRSLQDYLSPSSTCATLRDVSVAISLAQNGSDQNGESYFGLVPGLIGLTTIPLNALPISKLEMALKGKRLEDTNTDFIVVDLSAGSDPFSVRVFGAADTRLLVTIPEQSALSDMYKFLVTWLYQEIKSCLEDLGRKDLYELYALNSVGITKYSQIQELLFSADQDIAQQVFARIRERLLVNILFNRVPETMRRKRLLHREDTIIDREGAQFDVVIPRILGIPARYIGAIGRTNEFDGGSYRFLNCLRPVGARSDLMRVFSKVFVTG